ncbi:transposase DDE domain protein [Leptospira sp. Fiocruz LV4135]|nr:transposase DDE domain protein [Leptospira sp. Fiocruz LV4135]
MFRNIVLWSTILKVCDNGRIHSHKVFKDITRRGKTGFTALNYI